MTGWHKINFGESGERETLYLGLSAKTPGALNPPYRVVKKEAKAWERRNHPKRLLAWGTTASVRILQLAHGFFKQCKPSPSRNDNLEADEQMRAIRHFHRQSHSEYPEPKRHENPFIVPSVATARFTDQAYKEDMGHARKGSKYLSLFERLGVNERCGDRLFFICTDLR